MFKTLFSICFILMLKSCNTLYGGEVSLNLSNFKKESYCKQNPYDFEPDYYFTDNENSLFILYVESPDSFYSSKTLKHLVKEDSLNRLKMINGKEFIIKKINHKDIVSVDLVTGFKKGYILFKFKGHTEKKLINIYNTINIK